MWFSVKPQHESPIGIHIAPPFWTSLPSSSPSHPSRLTRSPCLSNVFKRHLREAWEFLGGGGPFCARLSLHCSPLQAFWPCGCLALSAWPHECPQSRHLRPVKPCKQKAHSVPPARRGQRPWPLPLKTSSCNCHTPCVCFWSTLSFRDLGSQQYWAEKRRVPIYSLTSHRYIFSSDQLPPRWYICSNQWTSTDTSVSPQIPFRLGLTLGIVHSMCLDKWMEVYIHLYCVTCNSWHEIHCLRNPLCSASSSSPATTDVLFYYLYGFAFTRVSYSWNHIAGRLQIGFFQYVICILVSSMSFHGLIARLSLMWNYSPLPGCTTVYVFIYWRTSWLLPSWTIMNKTAMNIDVQVFVGTFPE